MRGRRRIAVAAFAVCASAAVSNAAIVQVAPVNDRDGFSDVGAAGPYTLRGDGLGALIVGSGFDNQVRLYRAGIEFDVLSSAPFVEQATLTITNSGVTNAPAGYVVHGLVGDGVVTAGDLLTNNPLTPVRSTSDAFVIDVTAFVRQVVGAGQRYVEFTLTGFPGGSGFAFRPSEPVVNGPLLTIQSIPEPGSVGIVTVAAGLAALHRRRRRDQAHT